MNVEPICMLNLHSVPTKRMNIWVSRVNFRNWHSRCKDSYDDAIDCVHGWKIVRFCKQVLPTMLIRDVMYCIKQAFHIYGQIITLICKLSCCITLNQTHALSFLFMFTLALTLGLWGKCLYIDGVASSSMIDIFISKAANAITQSDPCFGDKTANHFKTSRVNM